MRINVTTILNCPSHRVAEEVQMCRLFKYITYPLASFVPVKPTLFPVRWEEGSYRFKIRLFGFLPFGRHSIVISIPHHDNSEKYFLRDNGFGDMISTWDHLISISSIDADKTAYTDSIEVKAGILTPFVWIYAFVFYQYRQYRLRRLVSSGFRYSAYYLRREN